MEESIAAPSPDGHYYAPPGSPQLETVPAPNTMRGIISVEDDYTGDCECGCGEQFVLGNTVYDWMFELEYQERKDEAGRARVPKDRPLPKEACLTISEVAHMLGVTADEIRSHRLFSEVTTDDTLFSGGHLFGEERLPVAFVFYLADHFPTREYPNSFYELFDNYTETLTDEYKYWAQVDYKRFHAATTKFNHLFSLRRRKNYDLHRTRALREAEACVLEKEQPCVHAWLLDLEARWPK